MLDPQAQQRFARHCTDAAFGYTAAATAAYAALADQVLNFWAGVLQPSRPATPPTAFPMPWSWPVAAPPQQTSLPFDPFAWAAPQRNSAPTPYSFGMGGMGGMPFPWFGMFPFAQPSAAWPMACMLMASGMPRSVAWPTAEANVAVLEAADVAAVSVRKVFASYRTDGGHSTAQQAWPPAHLMLLAVLVPLNLGAMLTSMRVG